MSRRLVGSLAALVLAMAGIVLAPSAASATTPTFTTLPYPLLFPMSGTIAGVLNGSGTGTPCGGAHCGYDISSYNGQPQPVFSTAFGAVAATGGSPGGYGLYVYVNHPEGLQSRYAHLSSIVVAKGAAVRPMQLIGYSGKTGKANGVNHLHWEVYRNPTVQPYTTLNYNHKIKYLQTVTAGGPLTFTGHWHLNSGRDGGTDKVVLYGGPGQIPLMGDWNGDGIDTVGVAYYDNALRALRWLLSDTALSSVASGGPVGWFTRDYLYGIAGDYPVVGDWDANGTDTLGVVRQPLGTGEDQWHLSNNNGTAASVTSYGAAGAFPVVGDWDCSRSTTVGVVAPQGDGQTMWYLKNAFSGWFDVHYLWGWTSHWPMAGEAFTANCDRSVDYEPRTAKWFLDDALAAWNGGEVVFVWGTPDDYPIVANWDSDALAEFVLVR